MKTTKPEILIVDDSPANIQTLAQLLSELYQIKVATDGPRGLELAAADSGPDLILLDVDMPGMSGYEVCQLLKAKDSTKEIPVIFITGMNKAEDEIYGFELGAIDYITKPFHSVIVEARVKTHITLKQQSDELKLLAMKDQLTNLYNRHYLMDVVPRKIARARRHSLPLSLIVIDVDHFKQINDQHGHDRGDEVLREVALLLNTHCRVEDVLSRFGGEEFVMLMDHCDLNDGMSKAETMRLSIEQLKPMGMEVTASFGVASLEPEDTTFELLFSRADAAMYRAKAEGRNCVRQAGAIVL